MSPELEEKLVTQYPELFALREKGPHVSCMCFGCECNDGWYDILSSLCHDIQQHIKQGHYKLEQPYAFFQIKEKYAGLRVYDNGHDEYIAGLIHMAESMSYKICETCGNKGQVCIPKNGGIWYSTKCPACAEKHEYRPYKPEELS